MDTYKNMKILTCVKMVLLNFIIQQLNIKIILSNVT
jgi:hypothetical protein